MNLATLANLPDAGPLPDGYSLVTCDQSHRQQLASLLSLAFPERTWDNERVDSALLTATDVLGTLAIQHGSDLVATASLRYMPDQFPGDAYLHWVGAHPAHSGKRLGRLVSLAVLHAGKDRGYGAAWLETDDFRLPAIKTYLALDFTPVFRDEGHAERWSAVMEKLRDR
jgi:mycothiol synthase